MTKPKPPIYPRPVSPLNAEPLRSNPADIFLDDSSDSGSNEEHRAGKRRRIESLGEQYLRGDGLFIMTAGLKGPLTGWVNPRSKKYMHGMTRRAKTSRAEIKKDVLEAAVRAPVRGEGLAKMKSTNYDVTGGPSGQEVTGKETSNGNGQRLERTQVHKSATPAATFDSHTPAGRRSKLRPSNDLMPRERSQSLANKVQATPAEGRFPIDIPEHPTPEQWLHPRPTLFIDTKHDSRTGIHLSKRSQPSKSDLPFTRSTVNLPQVRSESRFTDQYEAGPTNAAAQDNSSNCDLKSKRKPLGIVDSASDLLTTADPVKSITKTQDARNPLYTSSNANPVENLGSASSVGAPNVPSQGPPTPKGTPALRTVKHSEGTIVKVATEALTPENQFESISVPPRMIPQQPLPTQTSMTTNTPAMPSAQVVPTLQPPSTESYPSITSKMVESGINTAKNEARTHPSPLAASALPTTTIPHEPRATVIANSTTPGTNWTNPKHTDNAQVPRRRQGTFPFGAFKSPTTHTDVTVLDTQQMLAAITPLGFGTTKTAPLKPRKAQVPGRRSLPKLGKQKKRSSFPTPSDPDAISTCFSQGPIKGSLKVSKMINYQPNIGIALNQLSQPSLFSKLGFNKETSNNGEDEGARHGSEDENQLEISSLLRGEPHQQDGPLSSGPLPSGNGLACTGSTQQQDAQQEVGRYQIGHESAVEGQDDFNLASVMDDLGSFLGTWDKDNEATEF